MAYQHAWEDPGLHPQDVRRGWMNLARVAVGFVSLLGAWWTAMVLALPPRAFFGLILVGVALFAAMLISLGRDVSRRWIGFGSTFGFAPSSRRAFLDFGTDRPVLHGSAGRHAARLRLGVTPRGRTAEEWMQVEVDVLRAAPDAWVRLDLEPVELRDPDALDRVTADERSHEKARALVARWREHGPFVSRMKLEDGRLMLRLPFVGFSEDDARDLLRGAQEAADAFSAP